MRVAACWPGLGGVWSDMRVCVYSTRICGGSASAVAVVTAPTRVRWAAADGGRGKNDAELAACLTAAECLLDRFDEIKALIERGAAAGSGMLVWLS